MESTDDIRTEIRNFVETVDRELNHYEFRKREVSDTLRTMLDNNQHVEIIYEYLSLNTPIFDGLLRTVVRLSNDLTLHFRECQNRHACKK